MIRVLFVGNSFTFYNDMPAMVQNLCNYDRDRIHTVKLCYGGYHLDQYLDAATEPGRRLEAFLKNEAWDYVVLQDQSCAPTVDRARFLAAARELCARVRAAGAKPVFYATWAYRNRCGKQQALAELGISYEAFSESQRSAYAEAAAENGAGCVMVCNGFALAAQEGLYDELIRKADDYHPETGGSYLAAIMFARYFFGQLPTPLWRPLKPFPAELSETLAACALRAETDPPLNL